MAEELSPADRASLAAETGSINMSIGAAMAFDAGPGVTSDAICARIAERIHLIPRYRQRLEETPLGLANPVWVDARDFDPAWHVRHAMLPSPGEDAQLTAYVGREFSRRLDRSRPLWELHVLDGLANERVALVPKMHHALVDGAAAIDIGTVLLDPTPEPMVIPPPQAWEPRPYDRTRHLARLAATPWVRGQRLMLETAQRALEASPRRTAEDVRRATELFTELVRTRPAAPMTPFNHRLGRNRSYAVVRSRLDALKAAGKGSGGTVNDAILAAVCGMLARLLAGTRLDADPVALVPVNVRRADERGDGGNRLSMVLVDLPVRERDPVARLEQIAATMRELKSSPAVRAGAVIAGATGFAPPVIGAMVARALGNVRACNLVVSNIPGPQQPFYLGGQRLREFFPVVPLNPANQCLNVGVVSYDGGVWFGLTGDRELVPSVAIAARMLEEGLAELLGSAPAPVVPVSGPPGP